MSRGVSKVMQKEFDKAKLKKLTTQLNGDSNPNQIQVAIML